MPTRAAILTEAATWLGCPYRHQASLKAVGCDCIGLIIGIARHVGCLPWSYAPPSYSSQWHLHRSEQLLADTCEAVGCQPLAVAVAQPGDFLLLQYGRVCSHAALLLPGPQILHAARDFGRVVQHTLAGDWARRVRRAYAFPGLEPEP